MDGAMNVISDPAASAWYQKIAADLQAEWDLIKATRNKALIRAHAKLHYDLADLATALGVPGGVQTQSGGGDKPPHPS